MTEFLVSWSTGAMSSLLEKLGTLLTGEYELLYVRGDIESLMLELESMHVFLIMMANMEKPDEQARLRADAVREMSYDIEDNIDKFMILVTREPTSMSDGLMDIIDKIKIQVKEINERYKRYKIKESCPRNKNIDPRVCTFYKDASELVGINGPRDELVKWLSNKESESGHQPKVLSIVGYGGLGKTTLAKQVYDKLKAKYECRAFVTISRSPDMTQILSSILCGLRNQDYAHAGPDPRRIINQIKDVLKDRSTILGDLECLETLDVDQTNLVELPESVTRLQRLARLSVDAETKFPDGIGNMKNLQELGAINPLKQSLKFVEELGKLINLKKLSIRWDTSGSTGKESFKEDNAVLFFSSLRKLETCKLASLIKRVFFPAITSIRQVLIKRGQFHWISEWLISLVKLESLLISGEKQDVEMIKSIPNLLELDILSTSPESIIITSTGGFERLSKLHVTDNFVFRAGAMPNLKDLSLWIKLYEFKSTARGGARGFSFGIQHLSSLARLCVSISCCNMKAADVEAAEGSIKSMADALPNHPTLEIERVDTDCMLQDDEVSDEVLQENQMISSSNQTNGKRKRNQKSGSSKVSRVGRPTAGRGRGKPKPTS